MNKKLFNFIIMALMLALLIVCSKITIPYIVPFTLQTLAICIISMVLKAKKAFIVVLTYIVLGLIGLPVFASGGGFHYIYSPTFGFIIGFLFYTLFVGAMTHNKKSIFSLILINFIGEIIVYIFGAGYMYLVYNINNNYHTIGFVLSVAVTPFIVFDLLKIILGSFIYNRVYDLIPYQRMEKNGQNN